MIIIVENEGEFTNAYIDKFRQKSERNDLYKSKHFHYPEDALRFIKTNSTEITLIIFDIISGFYDHNTSSTEVYGGVWFAKRLQEDNKLKSIPLIIFTVVNRRDFEEIIPLGEHNSYVSRNDPYRDKSFWKAVDNALSMKGGK